MGCVEEAKRGLRLAKVLAVLQRSPVNYETRPQTWRTSNPILTVGRGMSVKPTSKATGIDVETAGITVDTLRLGPTSMSESHTTNISPTGPISNWGPNLEGNADTRKCADG